MQYGFDRNEHPVSHGNLTRAFAILSQVPFEQIIIKESAAQNKRPVKILREVETEHGGVTG